MPSLRERLRVLGSRQTMERQWALRTTHSTMQLKSILREFIDEKDRIMGAEVGAEWGQSSGTREFGGGLTVQGAA